MGVKLTNSVLFVLLICCSLLGSAQEKPEVHKINGQKYYLHIVEKGNTLYGISKQYSVEISEIQVRNPVVMQDGLKVNQTLLIPITRENKRSLGGVVDQSSEFISHEVQPKETLYAISKQYNTSLTALLKANPEVEEQGLKAGTLIQIPMENVEVKKVEHTEEAEPDSLESHIVRKGETLFSLSQLYETTIDSIKTANNGLPYGLMEGMALRIPSRVVELPKKAVETPVDTVAKDTHVVYIPDSTAHLRIGLLLPFNPTFPDSNIAIEDYDIDEIQRVSLSFYRGFQFAVDSLAELRRVSISLQLMNSYRDTHTVNELIRTNKLDSIDVLVGPFFTNQFELVADYLGQRGVPVLCPVPKPSKILFKRRNAIKTTPSESMQLNALAEYLAANYVDSTVLLINSNKFQDQDNVEFFKSRMATAYGVPDTFTDDVVREVKLWDINDETLTMRMKDSGSYTLIVPSTNKVFVTKLLSELYDLQYETDQKYRFRVFGLEEWHKYEQDLDIEYLLGLKVTYPMIGYLNYNNYRIRSFFKHFEREKGYEPNRFSLMGFDIADYLMTQAAFDKHQWFKAPEQFPFDGLLMNFDFNRVLEDSGVENESVQWYEYDGYRLKSFAKWPIQEMK